MAAPFDPKDTLHIVLAELSKRGGQTYVDRADWLIAREAARLPETAKKPGKGNRPAVRRWLRNPTASSLDAAMRPRPERPKPDRQRKKKKLIPYAGKP